MDFCRYSYNDGSVWVINSQYSATGALVATAQVYNLDASLVWSTNTTVSVEPDDAVNIFSVPTLKNVTSTYFLRLTLALPGGVVESTNVYWLSTLPDVLDWKKSNFYRTPCKSYADFTALQTLTPVKLEVSPTVSLGDATISIINPTKSIAFAVRARLVNADGTDVAPIFWTDNYVTIWPGETVTLAATYEVSEMPKVVVEVFNSA